MANTNPLFAIAKDKHRQQLHEADNLYLSDNPDNLPTYTLGFCDGIVYCTEIMKKQIEALQKQVSELQRK